MNTPVERAEIDGHFQYKSITRKADGSKHSVTTEFSDWFTDDESAKAGLREIMEAQGYKIQSVKIGFPCIITLQ